MLSNDFLLNISNDILLISNFIKIVYVIIFFNPTANLLKEIIFKDSNNFLLQ